MNLDDCSWILSVSPVHSLKHPRTAYRVLMNSWAMRHGRKIAYEDHLWGPRSAEMWTSIIYGKYAIARLWFQYVVGEAYARVVGQLAT